MEAIRGLDRNNEYVAYTKFSRHNGVRLSVYRNGKEISYLIPSASLTELAEYLAPLKIIHNGELVSISGDLQSEVNKSEAYILPRFVGDIEEWFDLLTDPDIIVYVTEYGSGFIRVAAIDNITGYSEGVTKSYIFLADIINSLKKRPHISWKYIDTNGSIKNI